MANVIQTTDLYLGINVAICMSIWLRLINSIGFEDVDCGLSKNE